MESLVFHLNADKVDQNMLDSIKAYYGNRRVVITIRPKSTTRTAGDTDDADSEPEKDSTAG